MKHLVKLASAAAAVALIAVASPQAGLARTHGISIGGPTTQIECPGGHFICTIKNGKRVCTCGGPITG
jgi:hypothetical protein